MVWDFLRSVGRFMVGGIIYIYTYIYICMHGYKYTCITGYMYTGCRFWGVGGRDRHAIDTKGPLRIKNKFFTVCALNPEL